tara:strand:- start:81 stop:236 length:156 start_codon:yes stop_codon:yes gene_type:complete
VKELNKKSIILMGIDWSKAAELEAVKDLRKEYPETYEEISSLGRHYSRRRN